MSSTNIGHTASRCLIVKDPQREYKDKIAAQGITGISRVIGISKLRNKFKQYEAQRQLCGTYDLFLADDRVLPLLPHLIGSSTTFSTNSAFHSPLFSLL